MPLIMATGAVLGERDRTPLQLIDTLVKTGSPPAAAPDKGHGKRHAK